MKLAKNPRALVSGLALMVCALAPFACALEMSGLGSPAASATGTGGSTGEPAGVGGATGGAGGGASSVEAASSSDASSASSASSSSGGGGPPPDPCGPGTTSEFQDNFNDDMRNKAMWTAYAGSSVGVYETGQQVVVNTDQNGEQGGYVSNGTRSLLGCHVHIEVKQVVNSDDGAGAEVYFRLNGGPGQHLEFRQRGSDLLLISVINSQTQSQQISYSTSTHRWWRLHEANGTITWETSTNGQDWQVHRSIDTFAFGLVSALQVEFGATGSYQNTNDAHFDNVNLNAGGI